MTENYIKAQDLSQIENQIKSSEKESNKVDNEDSDYILKRINDIRLIIESKLENLDQNHEKSEIQIIFNELEEEYEKMSKFISDSSLYLPKYNQKTTQTLLKTIRATIDAKKSLLIPKSKFSFKTSFKANSKPSKPKPEDAVDRTDSSNASIDSMPFFGFKNKSNSELRMTREESFGKNLQLEGLHNSKVEIMGAPNTIKINDLVNCQIYCGPTTTSIFVSECKNCLFKIAAQQIRIHTSVECDFYIHVTSRAIIEDCLQIRFGPYDWTYDSITEDFKSANLDNNPINWRQIDDFDCLSTDKPSKNWSFIE